MRASKHILPPHIPARTAASRRAPLPGVGVAVARSMAVLMTAILLTTLLFTSLRAGAQEQASGSSGSSGSTNNSEELAAVDEFLKQQLEEDYILGQQRLDREAIDAAARELVIEIDALRSDAAVIEVRLASLDATIAGQEGLVVQLAREHDQLILRRSALIGAMRTTSEGIDFLENLLVQRAVAAYMVPADGYKSEMISSADFVELEKKLVLIDSVAESDDAVIQLLEGEVDLLLRQQAEVDALADQAQDKLAFEEQANIAMAQNRAEYEALRDALDLQIAEYTAEAEALHAAESDLRVIIEAREARFVAEAARRLDSRNRCEAAGVDTTVGSTTPAAPSVAGERDEGDSDDELSGPVVLDADGERINCATIGEAPAPSSVRWPSTGVVSSEFGKRWGRQHEGIDLAAAHGTPITAAEHGEVYFAGRLGGYGNTVLIDHGGGMHTLYAHQAELFVEEGDDVVAGQEIGTMGSTGRSTGPHLHFEIQLNGEPVDPLEYLYAS